MQVKTADIDLMYTPVYNRPNVAIVSEAGEEWKFSC